MQSVQNFAPRRLDCFDHIPSIGVSGGILVLWFSNVFTGTVTKKLQFSITIQFTSAHNGDPWYLSNVYGPCHEPERSEFINWFRNCVVTDSVN
jgi:hypothetical protein